MAGKKKEVPSTWFIFEYDGGSRHLYRTSEELLDDWSYEDIADGVIYEVQVTAVLEVPKQQLQYTRIPIGDK